jgi:two-component system, NtrC family, sensor kinase
MKTVLIFSIIFYSLSNPSVSADTITMISKDTIIEIGKQVYIYEDISNALDAVEIIRTAGFIKSEKLVNTFPITSATIWLKFILINKVHEDVFLKISEPSIDSITIFKSINNNPELLNHSGFIKPFKEREIQEPGYYFNLNLKYNESALFLIRLKMINAESMSVPLSVGTLPKFYENGMINSVLTGTLIGAIVIVILFNIAMFIIIKDRSYLLFVIFLFFVLLFILVLKGYAFQLLWPNTPQFNFYLPSFAALSIITSITFTKNFLHLDKRPSLFSYIFNSIILYAIGIIILNLAGNYSEALMFTQIGALITCVVLPGAAIHLIIKKYKPAIYYLVAWTFFFAGIIIYILQINNVVEANFFTRNGIPVGLTIETFVMSFALGYRMKTMKKKRKEAEKQLIESYKQNEYLVKEQNRILEEKMILRSKELEKAQQTMIFQEKLALLGQLSTGIAHEIQNPLNFINNFSYLIHEILESDQTIEEFNENKELLEQYIQKVIQHGKRAELVVKEILNHTQTSSGTKQHLDLNRLCEEYFYLSYNCMRITYPDINCTVVVEKNEKPTMYNGVSQHIAKLLLNIYNNAFYAVRNTVDAKVTLSIKTETSGIKINVEDNGKGIPEESKNKIFEPFFTTKPAGDGTGLGLSISQDIIKAYNGNIEVDSKPGIYTRFTVFLPN